MGYALQSTGIANGQSQATNTFKPVGDEGAQSTTGTEAVVQFKTRVAGTFSGLSVNIDNVGAGRAVKFRKNAADGNQVVNPTDTTAGVYTDSTHSDAVASGDLLDLKITSSSGTPTYFTFAMLFKASVSHAALYSSFSGGGAAFSTASTTRYLAMGGTINLNSTEAARKHRCRITGSLQNAQAYVSTARATDTTIKSRINGADGSILITLTGSTTGLFEDAVHSDTVNAGDDWCFSFTTGSGADTVTLNTIGCAFVISSAATNDVFSSGSNQSRSASATTHFYVISGRIGGTQTTESNARVSHGFPCLTSNMRLLVSSNSYSADATMRLRKNGANGNQVVTITASTTGLFEDLANTDSFATADTIDFSITGGTSGTLFPEIFGLTETDTSSVNTNITGVQIATGIGSVTPSLSDAISGVSAATAAGTAGTSEASGVTGISLSSGAGSLGYEIDASIGQIDIVSAAGSVSSELDLTRTGVAVASATGAFGIAEAIPFTGAEMRSETGAVFGQSLYIVGVQLASSAGALADAISFSITGAAIEADIGALIGDPSPQLSGLQLASAAGATVENISNTYSGVGMSALLGVITAQRQIAIVNHVRLIGARGSARLKGSLDH